MSQKVLNRIEKGGIIPVVIIEDPSKAVRLGKTFLDAGLDLIEITMRTERAMEAIRDLSRQLADVLVGAGTVFNLRVAKEAISSGAQFIVSPHLDEEIVTYCIDHDIVCIPGVYTPTEIQRAIEAATKNKQVKSAKDLPMAIKIFPASSGGPSHVRALKAVFPELRFVPLGGVDASNLSEYFEAGAWAVGGTWICRRDLIEAGNFARISELVKEALSIIAQARK